MSEYRRYRHGLKTEAKQQYASDYWEHLHGRAPEPLEPESITTQDAQWIRYSLLAIHQREAELWAHGGPVR